MWKDLSHVPSTSQATFLQDSQAVSVRSGQAVTADIRAVSVNYLCRFSWLQAVLAGAKPLQKVRAVSTHCSSRFSWLKPFQTFIFSHVFNNKEDMKLELGKKCLLEHFEFKVDRSSKTRYQVSCLVDGCGWRFRARSFGDSGVFFVKSFNDKHTCSKTLTYPHVRQANPHVVAHYLKEPLKDSGRIYRCNEIVKDFRQRFQVEITTSQAWRGKSLALELLQGSSRESFAELPLYCYNLERANPGSVTHIKTDHERRFEMVFVAIGAAIRTFICNLRPVVIIDAAHLKGEFKGTLFLAVGMDGNNQILPISYGIGKSEDGECWTWFLSKLKECIGEIPEMAIISDRANSIHLAVRNVFPHVYHGLCCRHLMMNLRLPSDKKKENEKLWWKTCKSYRLSDFNESFNALCLAVPRVRHTLTSIGFGRWARAHCPGNRYHYMTSNSAESINALSRHSRKMPVTQLLEFFRQSVQKWFYDRRLQGIHEKHLLTQWAQKKILKKN
ncbi:putative transposase, MuDR, plant, MULE transposase domain-containing protein [Helianthus annuus]|nr:putative transposase, MuDR, plant, MULE transposase domain-containing protein [Helianthus annuus]KAJ0696442.1 putative transposase, MuDR, plant, MULE transposase domain-containing protein [Helianthus annuus]